jgi:2'-5' RNA ligase
MRRRLFFAINFDSRTISAVRKLATEVQDRFGYEQADKVRFMSEENWHLTVLFLGEQDDAALTGIMNAANEAARHFAAPEIVLESVAYAPRKEAPRMIWVKTAGPSSRTMGDLRNFLEDKLVEEKVPFPSDRRPFSGHVTLARLGDIATQGTPEALPDIDRAIHTACVPLSFDLMESELSKRGATYTVLQKFPFSAEN